MWGHIDGSLPSHDEEKHKEKYIDWKNKDSRIMAWIIEFVNDHIVLNLRPYKSAHGVWEYLKKVNAQSNNAQRI